MQRGVSQDRDPVSLRTVMSFLGKEYGGNLTSRVKRLLQPDPTGENLLKLLRKHSKESESAYPIEDILRALDEKKVFAEVSREQLRALFHKIEPSSKNVRTSMYVCTICMYHMYVCRSCYFLLLHAYIHTCIDTYHQSSPNMSIYYYLETHEELQYVVFV